MQVRIYIRPISIRTSIRDKRDARPSSQRMGLTVRSQLLLPLTLIHFHYRGHKAVLHDRPPSHFRPTEPSETHDVRYQSSSPKINPQIFTYLLSFLPSSFSASKNHPLSPLYIHSSPHTPYPTPHPSQPPPPPHPAPKTPSAPSPQPPTPSPLPRQ